jgi:uncharacterized protein YjiK
MNARRWIGAALVAAAVGAGAQRGPSLLASVQLEARDVAAKKLPDRLQEVSGLVMDGSRLLAHDDERAVVYDIDPATSRIVRQFTLNRRGAMGAAERGDFEGIAIAGDRLYLTTSDGRLLEVERWRTGVAVPFTEHRTGVGERCEVEGLAYDSTKRELLFACKATRPLERPNVLTILRWSIEKRALVDPAIVVPLGTTTRRVELHPSDLTRDPVTGHWIVLAAREAAIVELTADWRVVGSSRLVADRHPQAEGLAITREAVLIADEGGGKSANLTVYRRR